jgi:hypothetical protein
MKLTRFEDQWARVELGVMFPGSRENGFADIEAMDVRGFLAEVMGYLPFRAALGLRLAIWLLALAPIVIARRFATIAGLAPLERERVVTVLSASPIYAVRSLVMMLKTMGAMLYAGDDAVRARLRPQPSRMPIPLRIKRAPAHVA